MSHYIMVPMHVTLLHDTYACHTIEWYHIIMTCYQCMSHYGMVSMRVTLWHDTNTCHTIAQYQCMSHYGMVPNYGMVLMYKCTSHYVWMHVTLWMRVTLWHDTNACHTVAWYQCISHYGMKPMHVTLWHDTNVCHGMGTMHVTLYGMIPMVTLWHASYHCVTVPINVHHTEA